MDFQCKPQIYLGFQLCTAYFREIAVVYHKNSFGIAVVYHTFTRDSSCVLQIYEGLQLCATNVFGIAVLYHKVIRDSSRAPHKHWGFKSCAPQFTRGCSCVPPICLGLYLCTPQFFGITVVYRTIFVDCSCVHFYGLQSCATHFLVLELCTPYLSRKCNSVTTHLFRIPSLYHKFIRDCRCVPQIHLGLQSCTTYVLGIEVVHQNCARKYSFVMQMNWGPHCSSLR